MYFNCGNFLLFVFYCIANLIYKDILDQNRPKQYTRTKQLLLVLVQLANDDNYDMDLVTKYHKIPKSFYRGLAAVMLSTNCDTVT